MPAFASLAQPLNKTGESKFVLNIILNKMNPQAEKIIADEQAGFRARGITTEHIFNRRILGEKHFQYHQDLYNVFIDSKKAFDKVWHAALMATLKRYISASLIRVTKHLYYKATSAVPSDGSIGKWFSKTAAVRQGCPLSPTLLDIFLKIMMTDALEDHEGTVSIKVRAITNLRYSDNIDGSVGRLRSRKIS